MKGWLKAVPKKPNSNEPIRSAKYCTYIKRIQCAINRDLEGFTWLAENCPEVFLDEEKEYSDATGKIASNRRIKKLIEIIMKLKPHMQVELVLKAVVDELEKGTDQ